MTILGAAVLLRFIPKTSIWRKISLKNEQKREQGFVVNKDYGQHVGQTGVAISPLRPAGVGEFGDERLDVVSEGGFIEKDTPIKIVRTEGIRLIVREHKPTAKKS